MASSWINLYAFYNYMHGVIMDKSLCVYVQCLNKCCVYILMESWVLDRHCLLGLFGRAQLCDPPVK
jgi:hypothetical protein